MESFGACVVILSLDQENDQWRRLLPLFLQALKTDQLSVSTLQCHELVMCSLFCNNTFIKHINDIGFLDGAQSVGDSNCRSSLGGRIEGGLYYLL